MGALAMGMVACDEPAPTVPPVQSNPQGPVLETSDVYGTVEGPIAQGSIDLENFRENPIVEVYKLDSIKNVPAGTVTTVKMEISNTESFTDYRTIDTYRDSLTYSVDADALNTAHTSIFGKSSKERKVFYRFLGYVTTDGVTYRIGGTDHYIAAGSYLGKAFEMGVVEYLCTPGGANEWNQENSSWLKYSESKDYNCGVLRASGLVKFTDGNTWADDKTWGDDGNGAGILAQPGENIAVASPGLYWGVVNIGEGTYSLTPITSIGVVGGLNGWAADAPIEFTPNADQSIWSGEVDLTGDWKIIINKSWDSNYGGSVDSLVFDSGNINGYEGKYEMTFDCTGNYPTLTLVQK